MFASFVYSVIKEALRSSVANATQKHIEEASLAALFLMDAAKKADRECLTTIREAHSKRSYNRYNQDG